MSTLTVADFPYQISPVPVGDGESLSVVDVGTGPAVVFSHGTPSWSYEWRALIAGLMERYRCIAMDHLGFGNSPRPAGADYRPEAHARRFAGLLESLGLERYVLVAHDFGGPFALEAALERPERVAGLVLINTIAWPFGETFGMRCVTRLAGSGLFRWLYRNVNMSFKIARSAWGDRATLTAATFEPYEARFPDPDSRERVLFALARSMSRSEAYFASLEARLPRLAERPVHLVWGMADHAFPPVHLARFRRHFPRASVLEMPGIGHWPHEERPAAVVESVRGFLDGKVV